MSPLLFVVLLGLLAGLVLFLIVLGIGALINAGLNRIPARGGRVAAAGVVESEPEERELVLAPAPEMALAAGATTAESHPPLETEVESEPVEVIAAEETPKVSTRRSRLAFPKRAEAERVAVEDISTPEPEAAEPAVEVAQVVEVAAEEPAARQRRFPRPAVETPLPATVAAGPEGEPEEEQAEVADPFAAVMAALNKR